MRLTSLAAALAAAVTIALAAAGAVGASPPSESALFVQPAKGGSFVNGKLTLRGVSRHLTWFSDRPKRKSGVVSFRTFRRTLFSGRQPAPNAALEVAGRGLRGVVAVRLRRPRYDRDRRKVTYRVKRLDRVGGRLHHLGDRLTGQKIPRRFGAASLFIDSSFGNTCIQAAFNSTGLPMHAISSSKWSTDSWDPAIPPGQTIANNESFKWGSQGGFLRGCSNTAVWQVSDDPTLWVSLGVTAPWSGSASTSCSVSDTERINCKIVSSSATNGVAQVSWAVVPGSLGPPHEQ